MSNRIELENKIAQLTRAHYSENGIEYLVGRLSSLCTDDQLAVLVASLNDEIAQAERYWCVYCENEITNNTHCVPCNEYKGAMTFKDFVKTFGYEPKPVK